MTRPRVVIVGAGFGGLRAARALRKASVDVVLVDRHNYHLFQPLLYQVATAGLEPESIARPVRAIVRRQANLEFRMLEVTGLDTAERLVRTSGAAIPYDFVILAPGSATDYHGKAGLARHAFDMKELGDAIAIRNHVLERFEVGVLEPDPDRRRGLLTIAVVGGGPTGVEVAGAVAELVRLVLVRDYPRLNLNDTRILLLEAGDRLLTAMPPRLSAAAADTLWHKHVEVRFGAAVEDYDGAQVRLRTGEVIPAGTLIWAAGAQAAGLVERLGFPRGPQGRVRVRQTLEVPDHPGIYVIGDAAFVEDGAARHPMMASVAIQMADAATQNIQRQLRGEAPLAFRYRDPGSLATIGRNAAVAYVGGFSFRGWLAWCVWLVVHLQRLIGFRNKLLVLVNWMWEYFLYERGSRLIAPVRAEALRE